MKNTTLGLFAAAVFFGWTTLAAGALGVLFGDPTFSSHRHTHEQVLQPVQPLPDAGPLYSAPLTLSPAARAPTPG